MKICWICILWLMMILPVYAQNTDSLQHQQLNLHREYNSSNASKILPYIAPTILVTYGLISLGNNAIRDLDFATKAGIVENHPKFSTRVDDYLQFASLGVIYGLGIAGVKGKNSVLDQTAMVLITSVITTAVVTKLKRKTHRLRPNESAYNAFPSGHTATAFAEAELLNQEFKEASAWYGYAGYTVATITGVLRIYNNKHWLSDVVAGAGFGILSTKLTYVLYPYIKKIFYPKNRTNLIVMPSYQNQSFGFNLHSRF